VRWGFGATPLTVLSALASVDQRNLAVSVAANRTQNREARVVAGLVIKRGPISADLRNVSDTEKIPLT
jgi:hypothetical protein